MGAEMKGEFGDVIWSGLGGDALTHLSRRKRRTCAWEYMNKVSQKHNGYVNKMSQKHWAGRRDWVRKTQCAGRQFGVCARLQQAAGRAAAAASHSTHKQRALNTQNRFKLQGRG